MVKTNTLDSFCGRKVNGAELDWKSFWTEIEAVRSTAHPYEVFEVLARNPDWPFVPVLDEDDQPVGVVRERNLKGYAYSRFGRELIQRKSLDDFIDQVAVVSCDIPLSELLMSGSKNPNPDGLVLVENGVYRAVLLNSALICLHEEHHLQTQARLANAEKMEAIGTLAGGIAHDLNNILTPIIGYADLMREDVSAGQPVHPEMLDQVMISAKRGRQTVKQILSFSRQQEMRRSPMHLGDTIREVIGLLGSSLPSTVNIEMRLETEQDTVLASSSELHQVLMNLCTNAYHAMRDKGGRIVISLSDYNGPLLGWSLHTGSLPDNMIRLSVGDEGRGIEPDVLPRIFEPFFTTKPQGDGTGMGLAIVHGILTRAEGMISVETSPGEGTVFHLYLPRIDAPVSKGQNSKKCLAAKTQILKQKLPTIRVLVVDDETQITRLAGEVFARYGMEVSSETDSERAWERFSENPHAFDVLVADQMMPGMKGTDLAGKVLSIRPELPVVLCTGYADSIAPEQAVQMGIRAFFFKPLDFGRLAKKIRGWFPPQ